MSMGACFECEIFDPSDEKDLLKKYTSYVNQMLYEKGHDPYQGVLKGSLQIINSISFKTTTEASNWLSQNSRKYEVKAVKVGDFNKSFQFSSKGTSLLKKLKSLDEKVNNFNSIILMKLKNQKSKFKSCPHCESKINVQMFLSKNISKSTSCPICQKEFLKTAFQIKSHELAVKEFLELEKKIEEEKLIFNKKLKNEICWFVGGWAAY